jgi:hypothetical protein
LPYGLLKVSMLLSSILYPPRSRFVCETLVRDGPDGLSSSTTSPAFHSADEWATDEIDANDSQNHSDFHHL